MKILADRYNQLEIEGKPNILAYAAYHNDTETVTLDGEFSLEELEAIVEYMKEKCS